MSKRYIEITSGYRNRNQWPCPSEFAIPIDCNNKSENPLQAYDPITLGYPLDAWYQVPYAAPNWQTTQPSIKPRQINGIYYSSLWPLVPSLDQNISSTISKNIGWIGAMNFSGGTYKKPILNSIVINPTNIWSATTLSNISYNPYYTPQNNYFAGAMLIRFTEDPSCNLNAWNNYQIVNISAPFASPANIGDVLQQAITTASGTIICILSPTSFLVVLSFSFTFTTTGGLIENTASGNLQLPGVFDNTSTEAFSYNGTVETSIISSYDSLSGEVTLNNPFSEDFDPLNDFYLIDFNTDPSNDWGDFISGGPRIFIPNGSNFPQAYERLHIQNYTLSSDTNNKNFSSKIIKYDFKRKIAYLDNPLPLKNQTDIPTNVSLYGSNTFTLRKDLPLATKTYNRISVCNGSIMKLEILNKGNSFKQGETIGTTYTPYFNSPGATFNYPSPDYLLISSSGNAFRGTITSIDKNGGILSIKVEQQGCGYSNGKIYLKNNTSQANGENCTLFIPNVYQSLEVYRNSSSDTHPLIPEGNFVFLPKLGSIDSKTGLQNTDKFTTPPSMPQYFFPPNSSGIINPYSLDIKQNGYPQSVISCDIFGNVNIPESGIRQVVSSYHKDITFGDWWVPVLTGIITPITVLFLHKPWNVYDAGLTYLGTPVYNKNSNLSYSGFLVDQQIEYLQYSLDNLHPLNFTGTRVSQSQMVCFEIKLISLTLPNQPLDNKIGGLISFYRYVYVEFSNINTRGNKGVIYSNNPNANKALFKVSISDTSTPLKSKFIKLRGGETQTVKFRPNDNFYFRVFLSNGELFETSQKDTAPPLPPDFFLQISAQFEIKRLG
jgi:hypothetical protein